MRGNQFCRCIFAIAGLAASASAPTVARATTIDWAAAHGRNYDKAEFRLWYPKDAGRLQAVVVLVPGSNDDGRSMVEDSVWQTFATRYKLALVGCWFTDKPHKQKFIEQYVHASQGSGKALLDALAAFSVRSKHPELGGAPLLLWSISAGGEFNYEFVAWKAERVIGFIVNKGGIYYTALVPDAARKTPGMLFVGEKDLKFRTDIIVGLFAINRRAGALWALAEEPGVAHAEGQSVDMAVIFFEDLLPIRLGGQSSDSRTPNALRPVTEENGFVGDLETKTFRPAGEGDPPAYPTSWLPTARVARAWQAVVTAKPLDH